MIHLNPPRMREFKQPELTGQGGYPVFVPDDLKARMLADIGHLDTAGGGFAPLAGLTEAAKERVASFRESIRNRAREHVRVFDPEGNERYRASGEPDRVRVDISTLPGNVAIHNHPNGTPPSLRDILIASKGRPLEIQVVTGSHTYSVRPLDSMTRGETNALWNYLDEISYAVGQDWKRSQDAGMSDYEVAARRLHALMMELARRGAFFYVRKADVQQLTSRRQRCVV